MTIHDCFAYEALAIEVRPIQDVINITFVPTSGTRASLTLSTSQALHLCIGVMQQMNEFTADSARHSFQGQATLVLEPSVKEAA